mmetsp:Transcript_5597/g.34729  ORF Transcript_5597/g.34729 Transcript_5597/m.34729 type:complete len:85 (-) Transcript_5597:388-642(-)
MELQRDSQYSILQWSLKNSSEVCLPWCLHRKDILMASFTMLNLYKCNVLVVVRPLQTSKERWEHCKCYSSSNARGLFGTLTLGT